MAEEELKTPAVSAEELLAKLRGAPSPRPFFKLQLPWKLIGILGGLLLLLGATAYLFFLFLFGGKATLLLMTNESGASATIGERQLTLEGKEATVRLKPGRYEIALFKEGFNEEREVVELVKGEKRELNLALRPISVLKEVLQGDLNFISLSADGRGLSFFDRGEGVFKKLNLETGEVIQLFDRSFSGVMEVAWSPSGSAAIVRLAGRPALLDLLNHSALKGAFLHIGDRPQPGRALYRGYTTYLFDNAQRTAASWQPIKLSESVRQATFSPGGDRIAYFYETADGERSVVVANPDGSEWLRVVDVQQFLNPILSWSPNGKQVLLSGETDQAGNLYLLDIVSRSLTPIFAGEKVEGRIAWSLTGDKIAFANGSRLSVWGSITGEKLKELELPAGAVWNWKSDDEVLAVSVSGISLLDLEGGKKPIGFISQGELEQPQELLFAQLPRQIILLYPRKLLSLEL